MIPEFFSGMNVADVHFNAWNPNIMNGIPDGIAVVRIRTSIDDDCIKHQPCTVQLINNGALMIGLKDFTFHPQLLRMIHEHLIQFRKTGTAIYTRFPFSQQVQIGAVNHQNFFCHIALSFPQDKLLFCLIIYLSG